MRPGVGVWVGGTSNDKLAVAVLSGTYLRGEDEHCVGKRTSGWLVNFFDMGRSVFILLVFDHRLGVVDGTEGSKGLWGRKA